MNNTVILFCCHFWSPELEKEFLKLKISCGNDFDVVLSYDCSANHYKPPDYPSNHLFTLEQIKNMGYGFLEHEGIWHHCEYPIIDYCLRNPHYDFYWRIEYDVRFGGDWGGFFRYFVDNKADLLGTYLKTYNNAPDWYHWNNMNFKVDRDCLRGIFFPVVRFSRRAIDCLDLKYRSGASGFVELIVPTLLNMENLDIEDMGRRFYNLLTFNYNDIVIRKAGKLHHPVRKMKFSMFLKRYFRLLKELA